MYMFSTLKQTADHSSSPLHLSRDTRNLIRERDRASIKGDRDLFRCLRNKTARFVSRDSLTTMGRLLDR